jgi:hypothetical protein
MPQVSAQPPTRPRTGQRVLSRTLNWLVFHATPSAFRNRAMESWWLLHERRFRSFVFVHINKTGGTSISQALGIPWARHETAGTIRGRLGPKEWDRRFKFAFVRNPFDRVVSQYHYRVKTGQSGLGDRPVAFEEWVSLAYGARAAPYYNAEMMFMPQVRWVRDDAGNDLLDFVGRFERLEDDFARVARVVGVDATLPHLKRSSHEPYRGYYSDETRALVADRYRDDLDAFGYEF